MRQSACQRVIPREAKSRRQLPAVLATASSTGSTTRPATRASSARCSDGLRPRTISSTLMAVVAGTSPTRLSSPTRSTAGRPRRKSISTVESRTASKVSRPDGCRRVAGHAPTARCRRPTRVPSRPGRPQPRRALANGAPARVPARRPAGRTRCDHAGPSRRPARGPARRPAQCAYACVKHDTDRGPTNPARATRGARAAPHRGSSRCHGPGRTRSRRAARRTPWPPRRRAGS